MSVDEVTDVAALAKVDNEIQAIPRAVVQDNQLTTFVGAAAEPFSKEISDILRAPVDETHVEIRPDGIVFLPWVHVANRLNNAFGVGGWTVTPRGPVRTEGNTIVYHGAMFAHGRFIREAMGECEWQPNGNMSRASAIEGAYSDCVYRCAKNFGIGWELWDPGYRAKWMAKWALRAWVVPKDGRYKPKWYYWRKDRERPWQAEGLRAQTVGEQKADDAPPVDDQAPPAGAGDEDSLRELADLLDKIKWPQKRTQAFFAKYFEASPEAFTVDQMKDAFTLLYAFEKGSEAYAAKVAELFAVGRIAAGEVSK